MTPGRPALPVGVVLCREPLQGPMARWQPWRWRLHDVILQGEPGVSPAQTPTITAERVEPLHDGEIPAGTEYWLFSGYHVELYRDDAEGYYLNATSPAPCFWVMWREEEELADPAVGLPPVLPQVVTLSYHDAGRWLDALEKVDQVPAPEPVLVWMGRFVEEHFQVEPKRRRRPQSFQPLTDRFGQPVRITTDKLRRGSGGGGGEVGGGGAADGEGGCGA